MPPRRTAARAICPRGVAVAVAFGTAVGLTPARVLAQSSTHLDAELGAAILRQTGVPLRTAPALGGGWTWEGAHAAVHADGAVAAGSGDWAGQLAARAAYFALDADAPLELGGEVRAARVADTPGSTQIVAGVRRHFAGGGVLYPTRGVWGGGIGGATVGGGRRATSVIGVEAGAWRAISASTRALVTAAWTATRADSVALTRAGDVSELDPFAPKTSRVRTADATATVEHADARVELTASGGFRHTAVSTGALTVAHARWGALAIGAITWWMRPGVGAVIAAGTNPADPARALPAVQHVAFTLRLRPGAWITAPAGIAMRRDHASTSTGPAAGRAADSLRARSPSIAIAATGQELRVRAPGATRVQIRAAATGWRPVDLVRRADGDWTLALAWPSGAHRVVLRVDDGAWVPPANTPAVDDEYGGRVGLLVVP